MAGEQEKISKLILQITKTKQDDPTNTQRIKELHEEIDKIIEALDNMLDTEITDDDDDYYC